MRNVLTTVAAFGLIGLGAEAALAQTGILHKRVGTAPRLPASAGVATVRSSPAPVPAVATVEADVAAEAMPAACAVAVMPAEIGDVADVGAAIQPGPVCIVHPLPAPDGIEGVSGAIAYAEGFVAPYDPGIDGPPLHALPMPMPIDGDGVVHALPIGGPEFTDTGFDFDAMITTAMPLMMMSGAEQVSARGAEQAMARGAGNAAGQARVPRPSAEGLPQRAVGLTRPGGRQPAGAVTTSATKATDATSSAVATDRHDASATASGIQPVGRQTVPPRRWRDRLRLAWPTTRD